MKKNIKYIVIISFAIIIIGLLIFIGYNINYKNNKDSIDKTFNEDGEITVEENIQYAVNQHDNAVIENNIKSISANGLELKFTESDTYFDLNYKYPRGGIVNSFESTTTITYLKGAAGDQVLFKISMNKMKQKKAEDLIKSNNLKKIGNKVINQLSWEVYSDNENKSKIYTCLTNSGELYIIQFEADKDIESIEQEFMNYVVLK